MIDIKKLITGFLILATAASMSAILLVSVSSNSSGNLANTAEVGSQIAITGTDTSPISNTISPNVFVPRAPVTLDTRQIDYSNLSLVDPSSTNMNNLTEVLAGAYMNGVVQANPQGPQNDSAGNLAFSNPNGDSIAFAVASSTNIANLKTPDWDYEAKSQPIKISAAASPADLQTYSTALAGIMSQRLVSTGAVNAVSSNNSDATQAQKIATQVGQALGDTLALQVPKPLADFQKSIVKLMVYEKNTLALAGSSSDDPVKTALLIQGQQENYQAAIADFQTQMQKASALNGFSFGKSSKSNTPASVAFVNSLLGIHEAHAQWLTFDAAAFGQWILKFAQDLALQILKNTLVTLIQRKVLAWVQGSGAPRFVTQWGTTLINAYTQAALNAINSQMACIYGPFAQQTRLDLQVYFGAKANNKCANTFQLALGGNTFSQFYNNFNAGGLVAFQASLLPSGNQFGYELFSAQTIGLAGQNSQTGISAKLTSAQGLTGDQICTDGSNPGGIHYSCQASDGTPYYPPCDPGDKKIAQANNGLCANGSEPKVTTPGTFTGFGVSAALDSTPKLVAAANSIAGLLSSVLSSLMTTLAQTAISAANSAVDQGISGISGSSLQSGTATPPPPLPLGCTPPSQTATVGSPIAIGASGGKNDLQGNPPTYLWSSSDGASSSAPLFSHAFAAPGTYMVTLSDSAADAPANCQVTIQ